MKYLYLVCIFFVCACTSPEQEVNEAVMNYFDSYRYHDFRTIDQDDLSAELSSLIRQCVDREEKEVEKTINSDYPTDKPFIMEGDLFSSLYEGADSVRILSTRITSDTATVDVMFFYTGPLEPVKWNDRLVLVNEKGWKVDNIIFQSEYTDQKSTKDILSGYIQAEE